MKQFVVGCLAISALLFIGMIALFYFVFVRELPTLEASITSPASVTVDSTFDAVITAENPHSDSIVLDSIDVEDVFLEGFQVVSVTPKPSDTYSIFGYRTWEFNQAVQPGEMVEVTFTFRAVQPGHYTGDVDVCNPNQDFKTVFADVMVNAE